jgi:S1-C subfamily serine protease
MSLWYAGLALLCIVGCVADELVDLGADDVSQGTLMEKGTLAPNNPGSGTQDDAKVHAMETEITELESRVSTKEVVWGDLLQEHGPAVVQMYVVKQKVEWTKPQMNPEQFEVSGTGWFINNSYVNKSSSDELLIVTNAHVASDADSISIRVSSLNKEPVAVEVVGVCTQRDIALLRVVDPAGLRALVKGHTGSDQIHKLTLGDSDSVALGDKVVALGFPLGFNGVKITMGIFSGYQVFEHALYGMVDAAINPGNSGGPLLNDKGLVLGINSAKMEGANGMSFAIPARVLQALIDTLYVNRELRLPFLGAKLTRVSAAMLAYSGIQKKIPTARVKTVVSGGIFANAGVAKGDLLLSVHNHSIDRFGEFQVPGMKSSVNLFGLMSRIPIGTEMALKVWRPNAVGGGQMMDLSASYTHTPLSQVHLVQESVLEPPKYQIYGGIVFSPLTLNLAVDLLKADLNFDELFSFLDEKKRNQQAVIVADIIPGSPASQSANAVTIGQVVSQINGKLIRSMEDLCEALTTESEFFSIRGTKGNFAVFSSAKVTAAGKTSIWKDTTCVESRSWKATAA